MSPSRRAVLGAGLAGTAATLLAGCGGGHPRAVRVSRPGSATSAPPATPTILAARQAETALLAAYAATLARHPALDALLSAPRAHHRAHAAALGASPDVPTPSPGAAGSVPDSARAAVLRLVELEQSTSTQHAGHAVTDTAHGSLLAALAAAEAVHADLLTTLAPTVVDGPG